MSQHLYWVTKEVATIEGSRKVREKPHEERQLVGKKLINENQDCLTYHYFTPIKYIIVIIRIVSPIHLGIMESTNCLVCLSIIDSYPYKSIARIRRTSI